MISRKAAFISLAPADLSTASDGWKIVRGILLFPLQVVILTAHILYLLLFFIIAIVIASFDAAARK